MQVAHAQPATTQGILSVRPKPVPIQRPEIDLGTYQRVSGTSSSPNLIAIRELQVSQVKQSWMSFGTVRPSFF